MRRRSQTLATFIALLVLSLAVPFEPAAAQLPAARLFSIYPAGGKQGTTVELTITGSDLDEVNQLYFDHSGIKAELIQEIKEGKPVPAPAAGPVRFKVTIAADTPLGSHDVRAIGRFGISNPRTFVVGDVIEVNETEPNNDITQGTRVLADRVPAITINGQINGATDIDYYVFQARAGQRILVDCYAQRIDSRLNARLTLMTAANKPLDANDDFHDRDPFLDVTIPADGDYVVAVTDQVYDGSPEYTYRLNIGTLPYIDYILPPAAVPGVTDQFTIYGRNLPGGQVAPGVAIAGRPLEQLQVQIAVPDDPMAQQRLTYSGLVQPRESTADGFEYRIATPQGSSNSVRIGITRLPIIAGTEPNDSPDKAQPITLPCDVHGQFQSPRDIDWYTFTAKANEVWVFEVISQRMGFPTDAFLVLRRVSDGAEIPLPNPDDDETPQTVPPGLQLRFATRSDDPISMSPALAEGQYQLAIRHQYGDAMGSPRLVYRMRVRPQQHDFRVVAIHSMPAIPNIAQPPDSLLVRQGGNAHVDVYAVRRDGFTGEIAVHAEGIPQGISCPPVTMGPGQSYVPLVFSAAEDAPVFCGTISIKATATIGGQPAVREARAGVVTWTFDPNQQIRAMSRLARSLPIAVRDGAPYRIVASPEKTTISRGLPLKLKLQITRRGDFKDQVVGVAFANGINAIPNVQLQPVNIAANQNEVEMTLNLPPNVPVGNYTVALRGNAPAVPFTKDPEGKNKQNVQVGDISTPVIVTVTDPVTTAIKSSPAVVKKGATAELVVSVTRQGGYTAPVRLQLTDLPGNVTCQPVDVPENAAEGKLVINAAANAANGSFSNVKVRAAAQVGNQTINIDSPVTINVE